MNYFDNKTVKEAFKEGVNNGIPIALGYFAVAFSLGIFAKKVSFTPIQGFINSFINHASAGEYAVYTMAGAAATWVEMAIMTLVVNARYLLMSTALSQKVHPDTPMVHRVLVGFNITDEIFAIMMKRPGYVNPYYNYGAALISFLGWSFGTYFGIIAGEILPVRLVSAFSVALYGMFLACIMPEARKSRVVAITIAICFVASYLSTILPVISDISSGTRTIILTIVIAAIVAILFPHQEVINEQ